MNFKAKLLSLGIICSLFVPAAKGLSHLATGTLAGASFGAIVGLIQYKKAKKKYDLDPKSHETKKPPKWYNYVVVYGGLGALVGNRIGCGFDHWQEWIEEQRKKLEEEEKQRVKEDEKKWREQEAIRKTQNTLSRVQSIHIDGKIAKALGLKSTYVTHYQILGVPNYGLLPNNDEKKVIKKSYIKLISKWHSDKHSDKDLAKHVSQTLNSAYGLFKE